MFVLFGGPGITEGDQHKGTCLLRMLVLYMLLVNEVVDSVEVGYENVDVQGSSHGCDWIQ